MKITYKTRTSEVLPLLMTHHDRVEWLLEQVPEAEYRKITSFTITEFSELLDDEVAYIERNIMTEKRFFDAFGKLKNLKRQMDELNNFLKSLSIDQSAEEKQAIRGVNGPSFIQNMMMDVVEFFNLNSFDEAEKRTVAEWLMVFQKRAYEAKVQRNLNKIFEAKSKAKQKRK